jgi:hypothetical protein
MRQFPEATEGTERMEAGSLDPANDVIYRRSHQ